MKQNSFYSFSILAAERPVQLQNTANSKPHYQGACQWCCSFIHKHRGKWWRELAENVWPASCVFVVNLTLFYCLLMHNLLCIGTLSTAVPHADHGFQKKHLRCCRTNILRLDRYALDIFTKAAEMLSDSVLRSSFICIYLEIHWLIVQKMRQQAHETGRAAAIPITVRQLEAIIRLSESLAKMRL